MILICIFSSLSFASTAQVALPDKRSSSIMSTNLDFKAKSSQELVKSQYKIWEGVRYRLGGNSLKGIDCSALMQRLSRTFHRVDLPRTTVEQMWEGKEVKGKMLKYGDFVFFKMNRHQYHVGFYIGENNFIHASTSRGVTISTLESKYWNSRFISARRILSLH
jgi:lipoprotein Spr